jgi:hypothetical protein
MYYIHAYINKYYLLFIYICADEQQTKVEELERLLGKVEDRLARLEVENNKLEAEVKISTLAKY